MEAGTEGEACGPARTHDVTVSRRAKEFAGEQRPPGVSGRDWFRTGQTGRAQELVARARGPRGEAEKQAAQRGAQRSRTPIEPPPIRDRRRRGAGRGGAFIVSAAGAPGETFVFQEERDGHGAQGVSLRLAGLADSGEGAVWLPQRHALVTARSPFRRTVRPFVRLEKEGAGGGWAARGAEHAATPGGIAPTLGDLLRGEALHQVRPECLVRPMGGSGRFKADALQLWKGFSCPDKPRAPLFPMAKQGGLQGISALSCEADT
jgi:hypothetical protein